MGSRKESSLRGVLTPRLLNYLLTAEVKEKWLEICGKFYDENKELF